MSRSAFWVGFAAGAAGATVATLWTAGLTHQDRMLRVDRSVKICRTTEEVFAACARLERMPQLIRWVVTVASGDDVSLWTADIEGHRYSWDVEIVQVIPNQVIGWKSHRGPKHSGTINFFSLGAETLVQVDMNCEPRSILNRIRDGEIFWSLGDAVEVALHDLKTSLESLAPSHESRAARASHSVAHDVQAKSTGTYGLRTPKTQRENSSEESDVQGTFGDL